eukprot:635775-Pyramimonas_sp.AAC.1
MGRGKVRKLQLHAVPLWVGVGQNTMAAHACILVLLILAAPGTGARAFIAALCGPWAIVGVPA